jgi:hypothetical protein
MLNQTMRTLLLPNAEAPPLELVARQVGATLQRARGRDAFTLSFRDGSKAALSYWVFERPGDRISKTVLALAARFRTRPLRKNAEERRDRILARQQKSKVVLTIGAAPPGRGHALSAEALRFIHTLAERTDALIYDLEALYAADGEKLIDVRGWVTDDVPSGYPVLPKSQSKPPTERWSDVPFVLVPALEPLNKKLLDETPGVSKVLTESKAGRGELVDRLLDLRQRIESAKLPPSARERQTRLMFALARATAIVEGDDVPAIAARIHGLAVRGSEIRDESNQLVLSTSGAYDPRALSPRRLLLVSERSARRPDRDIERGLSSSGLTVASLDGVAKVPPPLGPLMLEFEDLKIALRGIAVLRRRRLEQLLSHASSILEVSARTPMNLKQIALVLRLARSAGALTFDGWGFYDHHGRAFLVRSGAFDPRAKAP